MAFSAKSPSAVFKLGKPPSAAWTTPEEAKQARTSASRTRGKARDKETILVNLWANRSAVVTGLEQYIKKPFLVSRSNTVVTVNPQKGEELPEKNGSARFGFIRSWRF